MCCKYWWTITAAKKKIGVFFSWYRFVNNRTILVSLMCFIDKQIRLLWMCLPMIHKIFGIYKNNYACGSKLDELSKKVVKLAALSSMAARGVVTRAAFDFGASFYWRIEKASYFITSNYVIELMTFMCVYVHIYALYVITHYHVFHCLHISHYHCYCANNKTLQHVLFIWCSYDCIVLRKKYGE